MGAAFRVTAECVQVRCDGPSWQLLYKGAVLPESADGEWVEHLLSMRMVERLSGVEPVKVADAPSGAAPAGGSSDGGQAAEVDAKRAEAQGKLPKDGSMPDKRAGQAVWVEYLVAQGSSYEDVRNADKADLISLAEQRAK